MSTLDLKHVARLARLHLSDEELRYFQTQVAQILSFVEKLNEVQGLENVEPTSHPFSLSNVFREDQVAPSLAIEAFLKQSPQSRGRFFQVPKIIEDKS
jgi:aspartyl-tRNA(Asn)/glutamyl-tRNA(Gln) amidotransferase subunit C